MEICKIKGEYIQLNQFLKKENWAASGGEAKVLIEKSLIKVNGKVVSEVRKKLRNGDIVEFEGQKKQIQEEMF